jgi:hypothetical protein
MKGNISLNYVSFEPSNKEIKLYLKFEFLEFKNLFRIVFSSHLVFQFLYTRS